MRENRLPPNLWGKPVPGSSVCGAGAGSKRPVYRCTGLCWPLSGKRSGPPHKAGVTEKRRPASASAGRLPGHGDKLPNEAIAGVMCEVGRFEFTEPHPLNAVSGAAIVGLGVVGGRQCIHGIVGGIWLAGLFL